MPNGASSQPSTNGPHNTRNTPTGLPGSAPLPRSAPLQPDQLASPARPHADRAGGPAADLVAPVDPIDITSPAGRSCSPGAMGVSATAEATTIDITSPEGYVTAPRRHSVPRAATMEESLQGMSQRGAASASPSAAAPMASLPSPAVEQGHQGKGPNGCPHRNYIDQATPAEKSAINTFGKDPTNSKRAQGLIS
ncbi:hypothetical protein WJX84_002764 [Apatococcus fuscideae]|uniref:Uncharacterized protein n=1 Tax=Apatococcus fuscideae TaxID=2026836 RepID=A0AAW1T656_9CHLO